jgi:hypothetical protein
MLGWRLRLGRRLGWRLGRLRLLASLLAPLLEFLLPSMRLLWLGLWLSLVALWFVERWRLRMGRRRLGLVAFGQDDLWTALKKDRADRAVFFFSSTPRKKS